MRFQKKNHCLCSLCLGGVIKMIDEIKSHLVYCNRNIYSFEPLVKAGIPGSIKL